MPVIGIGGKITDIRQGRGKNPAGFNYNSSQFCNDNSTIQTPTAITPGGTYSISPALAGFNNSNGTFTPNSASSITGSKQYTVTHTLGTGEVAQSVITIFESFTVTITGPTSICDGATSDITLVATGAPAGSTYLWTPGNLTTSSIDVRPTTQTVYDVTVTNGACSDVDGHVVSINPKPSATITGDSSFCSTGGAATLTAGNPGTTTPYTYSWFLNGNSTGGNTNSITVSQEGNYTLQISDGNGCVSDLSPAFAVSRTPDDVATITYPSTICKVPVGTGGASGSFALDGYFPLYLDYNDAAANSSDGGYHTHNINGLDYYMPNSGVVIYHNNYSLTTTPLITGQGGTFNNPTGLSINTQTGVIDKNASTAGTYTVEYTTNGSCSITVSNTVTINDLDNASMSYSASEYCQDVTDPVPTKSSTGTFSSSSGLVFTNSTTGEIDLDASTPGTYKIGFVTNGTCPNSGPLQSVTLTAREDATFSYSTGSYCQNAVSNPTPTIDGTTGGTFSSTSGLVFADSGSNTGSSTGEINLSASTVGSYTITYTTSGTCSASSTRPVAIVAADVVSISYSASSYPQTGTDPSPTFSPSGGTFSATPAGLSIDSNTGVIDLSASSVNSYIISYTSNGTCPNTAIFNLSITSVSAAFNYSDSAYCQDAATDPIPTVTGTSGGTFTAAPDADADATAFISRVTTAGGSLSTTEEQAVNTLVTDLKSANIWSKMSAIYPLVGASAAACAQNLKSSSYTGTFAGGWTYASTGVTGNGNNNRMDTGLLPSTELSLNSTHLSVYSRTDTPTVTGDADMGVSAGNFALIEVWQGNFYSLINQNVSSSYAAVTTSLGHFVGSRISSSEVKGFQNGSPILTSSISSNGLATANISLGAMGTSYPSAREYAFASIGEGLTDAEASDFYTAVQAFQTTLSRNV